MYYDPFASFGIWVTFSRVKKVEVGYFGVNSCFRLDDIEVEKETSASPELVIRSPIRPHLITCAFPTLVRLPCSWPQAEAYLQTQPLHSKFLYSYISRYRARMPEGLDESVYKTVFDPTTLTKKGLCPVTHLRHQDADPLESHSLYSEIHGSGPQKIVFIMGFVSCIVLC